MAVSSSGLRELPTGASLVHLQQGWGIGEGNEEGEKEGWRGEEEGRRRERKERAITMGNNLY